VRRNSGWPSRKLCSSDFSPYWKFDSNAQLFDRIGRKVLRLIDDQQRAPLALGVAGEQELLELFSAMKLWWSY